MKQQQFLDLIQASQTTLKQELLNKHPESKYQLLMLSRSFDLLKQYVLQQEQSQEIANQALEEYFQLPITDLNEGVVHLSQELRHQIQPKALATLNRLNQADLMLTHPKAVKHG